MVLCFPEMSYNLINAKHAPSPLGVFPSFQIQVRMFALAAALLHSISQAGERCLCRVALYYKAPPWRPEFYQISLPVSQLNHDSPALRMLCLLESEGFKVKLAPLQLRQPLSLQLNNTERTV